jgi:hypothetical protein
MKHEYDLFERFPDGSSLWRACVIGLKGTRQYLQDLSQHSPNRFYALHLVSGKMVSQGLAGATRGPAKIGGRGKAAVA